MEGTGVAARSETADKTRLSEFHPTGSSGDTPLTSFVNIWIGGKRGVTYAISTHYFLLTRSFEPLQREKQCVYI